MPFRRVRFLFWIPDSDEPIGIECSVAKLRVALAVSGLLAVALSPSHPAWYSPAVYATLITYLIASVLLLWGPNTRVAARVIGLVSHLFDILFASAMTLFTTGPDSPFIVFLTFPVLTAGYRWGAPETLISATAALAALRLEAILLESVLPISAEVLRGEIQSDRLVMQAMYLAIVGIPIGHLADREKQRRRESTAVADLIRRARIHVGIAGTLRESVEAIGRLFVSDRALLVVEEAESRRAFVLDVHIDSRDARAGMTSSELHAETRSTYLFAAPAHSWHAADTSALEAPVVIAMDADGGLIPTRADFLPPEFMESHGCRSLLGVTVGIEPEWSGRLFLLDPQVGLERAESVRLAQRLVRDLGPAVRQLSLLHKLPRCVSRLERSRLARELHDGPIQTLSAAVMQLELLGRRADMQPEIAKDVGAVASLLRDEIGNVRDLTQDMRLGMLEDDSAVLVRDVRNLVDRFSTQSGISAHLVSDVDAVRGVGDGASRVVANRSRGAGECPQAQRRQ